MNMVRSKSGAKPEYLFNKLASDSTNGLYYKPMTIVNDDSRVVNKLEASLTDDTRVVIYNRQCL